MHELTIILENLRNELTIIKGFMQLHKTGDFSHEQMMIGHINIADRLSAEALNIIEMSRHCGSSCPDGQLSGKKRGHGLHIR